MFFMTRRCFSCCSLLRFISALTGSWRGGCVPPPLSLPLSLFSFLSQLSWCVMMPFPLLLSRNRWTANFCAMAHAPLFRNACCDASGTWCSLASFHILRISRRELQAGMWMRTVEEEAGKRSRRRNFLVSSFTSIKCVHVFPPSPGSYGN